MKDMRLKYWVLITGGTFFYSISLRPTLETIATNKKWLGSGGSLFPIPIPSPGAFCLSKMNIIDELIYNILIKTGIIIIINLILGALLILKIKENYT
ncbi:MAG: hypothetical protein HeimC3_16950 [Candidatus Heimdallarchaeota archaeon LC_3]|nr:MAG: hypothetical protein HeimC3_16950 [Candidatus Heimdallarchaeota archaeon LC_3]